MSQKDKTERIKELFATQIGKNEIAFMFLGLSGVIVRTSNQSVIIDPANFLKNEDLKALKGVGLILFTHSHSDHYSSKDALDIFKATDANVIAEPLVANDQNGKTSADKLTTAVQGKTYSFGEITTKTVQGIHRGPIMLYQIKLDGLNVFHGGDSGYVSVKDYPSDLAFLPTGSPSPTASPENALKMASELKPSIVVAIHGSADQNKEFESKVKVSMPGTVVIIPEPFVLKKVTLKKKTQ